MACWNRRFPAHMGPRPADGLLADELATMVLALNGQGVHTTREHIAALLDLGLLERRRDRVLRVAISEHAANGFQAMLAGYADKLVAVAGQLGDGADQSEETVTFNLPPGSPGTIVPEVRHHLVITAPPEAARTIPLAHAPLSIGRTGASDVVLPEAQVSRNHCQVHVTDGQVIVTDLGSTNGTFVDGQRIAEPTALDVDATLKIGPFLLTLKRAT
jgi:FHA domain